MLPCSLPLPSLTLAFDACVLAALHGRCALQLLRLQQGRIWKMSPARADATDVPHRLRRFAFPVGGASVGTRLCPLVPCLSPAVAMRDRSSEIAAAAAVLRAARLARADLAWPSRDHASLETTRRRSTSRARTRQLNRLAACNTATCIFVLRARSVAYALESDAYCRARVRAPGVQRQCWEPVSFERRAVIGKFMSRVRSLF